jgi:hypothetical protein
MHAVALDSLHEAYLLLAVHISVEKRNGRSRRNHQRQWLRGVDLTNGYSGGSTSTVDHRSTRGAFHSSKEPA